MDSSSEMTVSAAKRSGWQRCMATLERLNVM